MADHDTHDHTGIPGVGIDSGTSFPGSPSTGDLFHRTDLDVPLYRYDGTRWLSEDVFEMVATATTGVTSPSDLAYWPPLGGQDLWLIDFGWVYNVTAPHSGTQFWDAALHKYDAAGGGTDTTVVTLTTDQTSTTWKNPAPTAIGALLGTAIDLIYVTMVKHSSVGQLLIGVRLRYKVVAT